MSTLSSKSAHEISLLLDEYGIKHGPIVDSTRSLYEKKIREAMDNEKKSKLSSDRTFYREEEEEVTYVSYKTPLRNEGYGDREPFSSSRSQYTQRNIQDEEPYLRSRSDYSSPDFADRHYDAPSAYRTTTSYSSATPAKSTIPVPDKSQRLIPLWVQFLVFLVVAVFLYFVFCNMESAQSGPFKGLD